MPGRTASILAFLIGIGSGACFGEEVAFTCSPGEGGCECNQGVCLEGLECTSGFCTRTGCSPGTRFTDGRYEIDNGEIERILKKPCIGRKNYLHCGSVAGAKRLAAAYTLVMSCKGLRINVYDYLVDVITKLAAGWPLRRIRELVPDAWAAARATASTSTADPAGQQLQRE